MSSQSPVTIQMKAFEQYFLVALFIVLYKAVQALVSLDIILNCNHTKEVLLTSESVDEILKRDHSDESSSAVLSCDAVLLCCTR